MDVHYIIIVFMVVCGSHGVPTPPPPPPAMSSNPVEEPVSCPSECTCHYAPLHNAPFVYAWLRNWATADMPQLHENDVLDKGAVAAAHGPAEDAGVDATRYGLHATCALYPDTNLTDTVNNLPHHTMVLTVLQAAGCNYTVIEGDQLARLSGLRALHMQGFADHRQRHLSGHNDFQKGHSSQNIMNEPENESNSRDLQSLSMVLADDALKSLVQLEILDLQYVRLVAKEDARRPRRHIWGPISTTTMVDMPLNKFFRYAENLGSVQLPRDLKILDGKIPLVDELSNNNNILEANLDLLSDYYDEIQPIHYQYTDELHETLNFVLLNQTKKEDPVPYKISTDNANEFFAPFSSQISLKYLRLAHAHLDRLGPELLGGLINLHTFTLEFNHIHILPPDVFAPTQNIRHLSIAHNSLLSLDSKSLQGLTNLLTLDLSHNKLTIIGSGSLPHLPKLKKILLEGNPIKHVLPDSFLGINTTDTLTIGSPKVPTKIHEDAFRQMSNLKTLKVMNISFDSFNGNLFSNIPQLEDLTLHGNLSVIGYDAFTSTPQLKNLDFSRCNLTRVSVDAFFGLSQLLRLDMSHNLLTELNPGLFDHLSSLTEIFLHHNKLTTLPVGLFTPLAVKVIRLNHNPWDCTCNLLQLHPTQTNSVLQTGYHICKPDEKLITHCNTVAQRLVFDARVAPKCSSPFQFRNKDVYTVANRYLKCSKYHWDPVAYTEEPKSSDSTDEDKNKKEINVTHSGEDYELQSDDVNDPEEETNWRPLIDYTPAPILPLDLLNIAENQMLEEVHETTVAPTILQMILQDQTISKEEQKRRLNLSIAEYRANKNKIKQKMRLERAKEVRRIMKKEVWNSRLSSK